VSNNRYNKVQRSHANVQLQLSVIYGQVFVRLGHVSAPRHTGSTSLSSVSKAIHKSVDWMEWHSFSGLRHKLLRR